MNNLSGGVLFLFDGVGQSQSRQAMLELVRRRKARGEPLCVLVPGIEGTVPETLARWGIEFSELPIPEALRQPRGLASWWRALWAYLCVAQKLAVYFRAHRLEAICTCGGLAHLLSIALKLRFHARLIWPLWELISVGWELWVFRVLAATFSDRLVACSQYVAHQLGRFPAWRGRLETAYGGEGLEVSELAGPGVVAFSAMDKARAAVRCSLRAVELATREQPGLRALAIVRDATEARQAAQWIRESRLSKTVSVVSMEKMRGEPFDIFLNTDVEAEPCPGDVIAAMARGKAVVVSRLAVLSELVIQGQTGELVRPGDAEEAARALLRILRDSALRGRLGSGARVEAASRFSRERYFSVVEAAISGRAMSVGQSLGPERKKKAA